MSPTVFRKAGFTFLFFSREELAVAHPRPPRKRGSEVLA
jgi:hypothetical protein